MERESTMISKMFRVTFAIAVASLALGSAGRALAESQIQSCSNASLSGTYGFVHDETDSNGAPFTAALTQIIFDSKTATFTGHTTASHDGVIATESVSGTYTVASNCTGTGTPMGAIPFSIVVTSRGFFALHLFAEGFAVKQGSPKCTKGGLQGNYGFEMTGAFLPAPSATAVAVIGDLKLLVDRSGEGVIGGHVSVSEDGTFLLEEPVSGSYTVATDCTGTLTVTPKGSSALNFSFMMVGGGKEMLAIETDTGTVVSGTLLKDDDVSFTDSPGDR
jgi:hypothetical protein